MKKISLTLSFAVVVILSSLSVLAHDDDARVAIELEQSTFQAGNLTFQFDLVDRKEKKTLSDADLNILHEKKLHLFIFDPSLIEFRHEHPKYINGRWEVSTTLPRNANYWMWTQGEISNGKEEFFAKERLQIKGGDKENPLPPILGDNRSGVDGISKVILSGQQIRANKMVMLTVKFSREDGSSPSLTPYLGELAHAVGVLEDGDTLIHVHPMGTGNPNELMLHATFPEAGDYRLWVQFIDGNILKTVPLSVTVVK